MSKMSTEVRHTLNGATMGTRWSAIFLGPAGMDLRPVEVALQAAVDRVDAQMSPWKPDSDVTRLNRAAVGIWQTIPEELTRVLRAALRIGAQSNGLFDIGVGDIVSAWGFGPRGSVPDAGLITAQIGRRRRAAHEFVELDAANRRVRRQAPEALDLCAIAKGFAVDEMMQVMVAQGFSDVLVSIDGELSARGRRPDGTPWAVAVERPDHERREPLGVLPLADRAVATSGDYRHWVTVGRAKLSHVMDPRLGGPARNRVASVSVLHSSCMEADAWATVLMVSGEDTGPALARERGLEALFLLRDGIEIRPYGVGPAFERAPALAI